MTSLIPLHFDSFDVRMIMRGNVPWWVGVDAARMLEIRDSYQALERLEDYERGRYNVPTPRGDQEMIIINESGMYSLILRSRKPIAKAFKRWLTVEVLPSIRVHGAYPPPPELEFVALPAALAVLESRPARFLQECERLAGELGEPMEKLFEHIVSPAQFKAMRRGAGDIDKLLTREMRWVGFMNMGMDLPYVLSGQR